MVDGLGLLKGYINELKRDERFISMLQSAGLGNTRGHDRMAAESLAEEWLEDVEAARGRDVHPGLRSQVIRFVEGRLPALVMRFRGNEDAVRLTMVNILNAKFRELWA